MNHGNRGRLIAVLMLAASALAYCKTSTNSSSDVKNDEQLADQYIANRGPKQLKTLEYVFFRNNPLPSDATRTEIQAVHNALDSLDDASMEERLFRKMYHRRFDIMALAARDTDNDGIKDFRASQYYGEFTEGDLDLDGDGIRNILDADPYDPQFGGKDLDGDGQPDRDFADVNGNTIPDHLDFELLYPESTYPFSKRLSEIQVELYKSHKIILVERNEPFTLEVAEVVYDAVKRVFASRFGKARMLPTLRSIATETQAMLIPEVGGETHALVFPATQTLSIYRGGMNVPPVVLLGLLVHEIGHSIQYDIDYNARDMRAENSRIYFPNPKYFAAMEPFGWISDLTPILGLPNFGLWVPAYEYVRPDWTWRNRSPKDWSDTFDDIYKQVGSDYMHDPRIAGQNIVSLYSLTDPFEWLSDNQIAYVFSLIEEDILNDLGGDTAKKAKFKKNFIDTIEAAWPGFAHFNFKDKAVRAYLEKQVPISKADRKYLADRYGKALIDSAQIIQGSSLMLTGEVNKKGGIRCRPTPLNYDSL